MAGVQTQSFFDPDSHTRSARHRQIYSRTEVAYTAVDLAAAVMFVVGSVLFFWTSTTTAATWLFLVGSVLFGLRPTIRLFREFAYRRADLASS
jgi:hypothetical protein